MKTQFQFTKFIKILSLILLTLFLSACTLGTKRKATTLDSSVFLSIDGGNSWREATALASPGATVSTIRNVDVYTMSMDPQDSLAVYLASTNSGLYYTYNIIQDGWSKVKTFPGTLVRGIVVNPKNKCNLYALYANQVHISEDCSRTWTQTYFDNNIEVSVNTIAIDHYNPNSVYIGTSRGEIIKSIDAGKSWRTIKRLNDGIKQIFVSPLDSRLVFVSTARNKIYSFRTDADFEIEEWNDLNTVLKNFDLGRTFRDFVVSKSDGTLFIATNHTILRSPDEGITWEKINLIQPEQDAIVNALAVDPQDSKILYYVTNTTFFKSVDAGVTWSTRRLPTQRAGRSILIDFNNPSHIYLGTYTIDKK